jgi:hypothetical protein
VPLASKPAGSCHRHTACWGQLPGIHVPPERSTTQHTQSCQGTACCRQPHATPTAVVQLGTQHMLLLLLLLAAAATHQWRALAAE